VAQHDPSGFDPPHRFVDELSLETLGHRFRRSKIADALAHELGHG
jgi:hypothetical protein